MKHFLSLEASSKDEITALIDSAAALKASRGDSNAPRPLAGQCWGMMFTKSSTRTRVSFEVGVHELGGHAMFFSGRDLQLGRGEPIKDTARVMGRMIHGAIIRNDSQQDLEDFASYSGIPTVNALTDAEHPCQILADLLTMRETVGGWEGKKVTFVGDADCNMGRSWIWAAKYLGFELALAGPEEYCPSAEYLESVGASNVSCSQDAAAAADGAHVLYTDVWISMGREDEAAAREAAFGPYQINAALLEKADPNAVVMHCLPAYREKEITEDVLEAHADTIFTEAENRLHAQKAVLVALAAGE